MIVIRGVKILRSYVRAIFKTKGWLHPGEHEVKLFLNIYDFSKTAVIKVLLTITEPERNAHSRWKWGCCHTGTCWNNSKVRVQKTNTCAGTDSEHRVHVTDRSARGSSGASRTHKLTSAQKTFRTTGSGMCSTLCQHLVPVAAATQEHRRDLTQRLAERIQRGMWLYYPGDTQPKLTCSAQCQIS